MAETCPMDGTELDTAMKCVTCGREWYWLESGGEKYLASRKRRVQIVAPIIEGARLDDCIKPIKP